MNDFGKNECGDRRDLTWFEDNRATRCNRRRDFRDHLVQRVVPWCYATYDTDRLPNDYRIADLFLERIFRNEFRVRTHDSRRQAGLNRCSEGEWHPDFAGDYSR